MAAANIFLIFTCFRQTGDFCLPFRRGKESRKSGYKIVSLWDLIQDILGISSSFATKEYAKHCVNILVRLEIFWFWLQRAPQWIILLLSCSCKQRRSNLRHVVTLKIHVFWRIEPILTLQPNHQPMRFWWKNETNRLKKGFSMSKEEAKYVTHFGFIFYGSKFFLPHCVIILKELPDRQMIWSWNLWWNFASFLSNLLCCTSSTWLIFWETFWSFSTLNFASFSGNIDWSSPNCLSLAAAAKLIIIWLIFQSKDTKVN